VFDAAKPHAPVQLPLGEKSFVFLHFAQGDRSIHPAKWLQNVADKYIQSTFKGAPSRKSTFAKFSVRPALLFTACLIRPHDTHMVLLSLCFVSEFAVRASDVQNSSRILGPTRHVPTLPALPRRATFLGSAPSAVSGQMP
jgi:hypothetical protein